MVRFVDKNDMTKIYFCSDLSLRVQQESAVHIYVFNLYEGFCLFNDVKFLLLFPAIFIFFPPYTV